MVTDLVGSFKVTDLVSVPVWKLLHGAKGMEEPPEKGRECGKWLAGLVRVSHIQLSVLYLLCLACSDLKGSVIPSESI